MILVAVLPSMRYNNIIGVAWGNLFNGHNGRQRKTNARRSLSVALFRFVLRESEDRSIYLLLTKNCLRSSAVSSLEREAIKEILIYPFDTEHRRALMDTEMDNPERRIFDYSWLCFGLVVLSRCSGILLACPSQKTFSHDLEKQSLTISPQLTWIVSTSLPTVRKSASLLKVGSAITQTGRRHTALGEC